MELIDESSLPTKETITIELSGTKQKFTLTPAQLSIRYPNLHKYWESNPRLQTLPLDKTKTPDTFAWYLKTGQIPSNYAISYHQYKHLSLSDDFIAKLAEAMRRKKALLYYAHFGDIKELDLDTGECLRTFSKGFYRNIKVIVAHNNKLYVGSQVIDELDLATGKWMRTFEGHSKQITAIVIHGDRLYSGSDDKTIRQWDLDTGACLRTLSEHSGWVHAITIHGDRLYSGSEDSTIKEWDLATGTCLRTFKGHSFGVHAVVVHDNELYSSGDLDIRQWNLNTGECTRVFKWYSYGPRTIASHDGKLYSGSDSCVIMEWDPTTGERLRNFNLPRTTDINVVAIRDNKLYIGYRFNIREYDLVTGVCLQKINILHDGVVAIV